MTPILIIWCLSRTQMDSLVITFRMGQHVQIFRYIRLIAEWDSMPKIEIDWYPARFLWNLDSFMRSLEIAVNRGWLCSQFYTSSSPFIVNLDMNCNEYFLIGAMRSCQPRNFYIWTDRKIPNKWEGNFIDMVLYLALIGGAKVMGSMGTDYWDVRSLGPIIWMTINQWLSCNLILPFSSRYGYNYRSGVLSMLFDNEAQDFHYASQLHVLVLQVFCLVKIVVKS